MILVVGGTGLLGSEICRQLAAAGERMRRLVRSGKDLSELEDLGVEIVPGDLRDPLSVDTACQGIECVITTASAMPFSYEAGNSLSNVDHDGIMNLIAAAKRNHVNRFVYISATSYRAGKTSATDLDCPLIRIKRQVEDAVVNSGIRYLILRPSYFSDIWLSPAVGFDVQNRSVRIYGSGENAISWISVRDLASIVVAAVHGDAVSNMTFEVGGLENLSPKQVIKIFEDIIGSSFAIENVPEEALRAQKSAATDPMQQSFAALMLGYAGGDPIEMATPIRDLGIQFETMHEYVNRSLKPQP